MKKIHSIPKFPPSKKANVIVMWKEHVWHYGKIRILCENKCILVHCGECGGHKST